MKKVFITEDNAEILKLYTQSFEKSGFETETAVNGEEALVKLRNMERKPDIILLDVMMPGKTGFEVLDDIKKNMNLNKIPVIVLTNIENLPDGTSDLEKIRDMGALDVIVKSNVDPKEVVRKVEKLLLV